MHFIAVAVEIFLLFFPDCSWFLGHRFDKHPDLDLQSGTGRKYRDTDSNQAASKKSSDRPPSTSRLAGGCAVVRLAARLPAAPSPVSHHLFSSAESCKNTGRLQHNSSSRGFSGTRTEAKLLDYCDVFKKHNPNFSNTTCNSNLVWSTRIEGTRLTQQS